MGRYCNIGENAVVRPPARLYKGYVSYYPTSQQDRWIAVRDGGADASQPDLYILPRQIR